ncbi:MAG: multiple sugar transport system permease protein [Phycisphaerales bacterium]|nr:multiple sugar transport system permease protein [Phycisphaerales bacterium]
MTGREKREAWEALGFLSPWIIGFVVFTAGPILASLVMSFYRWDPTDFDHPVSFMGLKNYAELARDETLHKSLVNTILYAAMYIPASICVALAMAMLMNQKLPGMRLFRTIFYLPTLTQGVATFVLWQVAYDDERGPINRFLRFFIAHPPDWLNDPAFAKLAIVIMNLWSVGGMMLIFLAGLQNIPRQLYEAAEIDGASERGKFFNITLPMLSPTLFLNMIMATIGAFQVFAAAFILTSGGPARSTLFYAYYLYNRAFVYFNMGYASAMAWLLFLIILILTGAQIRYSRRWVHYG